MLGWMLGRKIGAIDDWIESYRLTDFSGNIYRKMFGPFSSSQGFYGNNDKKGSVWQFATIKKKKLSLEVKKSRQKNRS